jgi:hypothetical protein
MQLFKYSSYLFLLLGLIHLSASEEKGFQDSLRKFLKGDKDLFLFKPEYSMTDSSGLTNDEGDLAFVASIKKESFESDQDIEENDSIDYEEYGIDKNTWLGVDSSQEQKKELIETVARLDALESHLKEFAKKRKGYRKFYTPPFSEEAACESKKREGSRAKLKNNAKKAKTNKKS